MRSHSVCKRDSQPIITIEFEILLPLVWWLCRFELFITPAFNQQPLGASFYRWWDGSSEWEFKGSQWTKTLLACFWASIYHQFCESGEWHKSGSGWGGNCLLDWEVKGRQFTNQSGWLCKGGDCAWVFVACCGFQAVSLWAFAGDNSAKLTPSTSDVSKDALPSGFMITPHTQIWKWSIRLSETISAKPHMGWSHCVRSQKMAWMVKIQTAWYRRISLPWDWVAQRVPILLGFRWSYWNLR